MFTFESLPMKGVAGALPIVALLGIFLYSAFRVFIRPLLSPLRHLPAPKQSFALFRLLHEPRSSELEQWLDEIPHNGLIRYYGAYNEERIFIASPEAAKDLLSKEAYTFIKPKLQHTMAANVAEEGLLLQEGHIHKVTHKQFRPAFSANRIKALYPDIWKISGELNKAISDKLRQVPKQEEAFGGRPLGIAKLISASSIDTIGKWGFSTNFNAIRDPYARFARSYIEGLKSTRRGQNALTLSALTDPMLVLALPVRVARTLRGVMRVVRKTAADIVEEHEKALIEDEKINHTDVCSKDDMLTLLMKSKFFSHDDLVTQTIHFLAASTETSSGSLVWGIHLLSRHPDMQSRLREEVQNSLPNPGSLTTVEASDFDNLEYLNAVIKEVLRFHSINTLLWREAIEDTEIVGVPIAKGTKFVYSPWALNRDPRSWGHDARTFNPDRWLGEGKVTGGASHPYAFLTFGAGPRRCIGEQYAIALMRVILAGLVAKFEFWPTTSSGETDDGRDIGDDSPFTIFKILDGWKTYVKEIDGLTEPAPIKGVFA